MKSEPKAFASLSSGLLARKGAARPAMRPQGFNQASGNLDDLGWNDMGFEPPKPSSTPLRDIHAAEDEAAAAKLPFGGLTPLESPVHSQQAEIADRLGGSSDALDDDAAEDAPEAQPEAKFDPAAVFAAEPAAPVSAAPEPFEDEAVAIEPMRQVIQVKAPQRAAVPAVAPVAAAPRRAPRQRSAPGSNGKAAFTLRLDPDRHLKLRLACAVDGRSAQQLVTDALDQLLAAMPELEALAEKAKRKGS